MKSPCTRECWLVEGQCKSCKRTREQIINWTQYTDEEREKIIKKLQETIDK